MDEDSKFGCLVLLFILVCGMGLIAGIVYGNMMRCEKLEAAYPQYSFRLHKGSCQVEIGDGI